MELRATQVNAQAIDQTLATVPFLRRLSPRQRVRLAKQATTRRYPAGAMIVREGDTSMTVYVVLSGAVQIRGERPRGADGVGAEGVRTGRGASFGAMGVIHDRPRGETVVALEPTECVLLAKWDFTALLLAEPRVALDLMLQATGAAG